MQLPAKILIVEDELIAAENLKEYLTELGHEVIGVTDKGKEAIQLACALCPDVIFMDIMLKDSLSGSEAALQISRSEHPAKIIFLTAYAQDEMVDYAVQAHAAAYLIKPYNKTQIKTTLQLVLNFHGRRALPGSDQLRLKTGFCFDTQARKLYHGDEERRLSPKSLQLLECLCRHPGESVSNEQISMHIWGEIVDNQTLRALIYRTRSHLRTLSIQNVSGMGYKVEPECISPL